MEETIKKALLDFNWSGYGLDDVDELASEDPDVGVFDALAARIALAVMDLVKLSSCGCV